jgi:archaellum component FlaC
MFGKKKRDKQIEDIWLMYENMEEDLNGQIHDIRYELNDITNELLDLRRAVEGEGFDDDSLYDPRPGGGAR